MNCKDVEGVVNDLASDQIMDASLRETALSHAASCSGCASRLDDARALTGGMRWLAAEAEAEEAPARIEASLVAAFRKHHSELPRIAIRGTRAGKPRLLYIAAGIAAAAVIVMLISLIVSPTPTSEPRLAQDVKQAQHEGRKENTAPAVVQPGQQEGSIDEPNHKRGLATIKHDRKSKPSVRESERSRGEVEIATDFIPLVNRESLRELDSGQLMRVELPRSALMSFGLPIDMERANERVKADVVVGQDGLARAIRFVR